MKQGRNQNEGQSWISWRRDDRGGLSLLVDSSNSTPNHRAQMKPPSPHSLLQILNQINWSGHVELGNGDLTWLAGEIASLLSPRSGPQLCESCSEFRELVIPTRIGRICEACLDDATDAAKAAREEIEG